mgnify:CR=1 FL=1
MFKIGFMKAAFVNILEYMSFINVRGLQDHELGELYKTCLLVSTDCHKEIERRQLDNTKVFKQTTMDVEKDEHK